VPALAVAQATEEKKGRGLLSDISKRLMSQFDLTYLMFGAAPGGEALAIAVANAGGMGALSMSWSSPDRAYDMVVPNETGDTG
jgi:hypothetical protein